MDEAAALRELTRQGSGSGWGTGTGQTTLACGSEKCTRSKAGSGPEGRGVGSWQHSHSRPGGHL